MGTSTVSGPFRSANGFQELVNGQWVPVAGGGGGVPNTCLVQVPINIDCTVYTGFSGSEVAMKLELPFTVQEVTDSIASGGVWSKFSGYQFDVMMTRYPRAGTPLSSCCFFWEYAFSFSDCFGPHGVLMVNPTVINGQYGYTLYTSCNNPIGSSLPPVSSFSLNCCMGGGLNGFPTISSIQGQLDTGSCGSPFSCETSPDSFFCIRADLCAYYGSTWFAKTQCAVNLTEQGYILTGVANVQLNFFNQ